jgi:hypothetical protein
MQRKATKQSPAPSAAAMRYMKWTKLQEHCAACEQEAQLIFHHCEGSAFKHNKEYIGPWFGFGLCQKCDDIVTHGSRRKFREIHGPQSEIWHKQLQKYPARHECPMDVFAAIANYNK